METPKFPYFEAQLKENRLDPRERYLRIDNKYISFDSKIMCCSDIIAIRYGSMQMFVFHRLRTDKYYKIELKDKNENIIKMFFGLSKLNINNSGQEENYDKIIDSLWHAVKKRLVNEALDKINNEESFTAGDCTVMKDGIKIIVRAHFIKTPLLVPWKDVEKKMSYGRFYIFSKEHPHQTCKINFLHTWNSVVLFSLLEFLMKQNQ